MNQIWQNGEFKIYKADDGFILHNSKMEGFAHSHIKNFKTAVYIAELSMHKRIPHDMCRYLLISLLRVNSDVEYLRKIQDLIDSKQGKSRQFYINPQKGKRR